jgi:hypothetical protein
MSRTAESTEQRSHRDAATAPVVAHSVVAEADRYSTSVAGIELEAVRAGAGVGASEVTATRFRRFTFTSSKIGFPMLSRTTLRDDMLCVAYMQRTIPGSRWCEMSLAAGDLISYAPSSEHTARNLPGTEFMFVIGQIGLYEEHAEELGVRLAPLPRGQVSLLPHSATTFRVIQPNCTKPLLTFLFLLQCF